MYIHSYNYDESEYLLNALSRYKNRAWYLNVILKSDSTHHFFRNACTKSGSLRFSQYSGCWLIFLLHLCTKMTFQYWQVTDIFVTFMQKKWPFNIILLLKMKQKRQSPVNIELVLFTVKMKQKRQSPVNIELVLFTA
jgi:hypothetical protein